MNTRLVALLCVAVAASAVTTWSQQRTMTMPQLFELVDKNSHAVAASLAGVEVATAGVEAARSERLPDINTSLSLSYNGNALLVSRELDEARWTHTPHLGNSFALEVQQVLYSGGAITAGIRMAEISRRQAEAQADLTRQQQRFLALGYYLDIYKLNNRMQVYESNIALTRRLIDDITLKHSQGMVLRNDITRNELQLQQLELGLTQVRNRRDILNHRLCNALGLPEGIVIVPADDGLAADDATGEQQWQQQATASSPVLKLSDLSIDMARQNETLARSEMRPKVALFAADNFNGPITFEVPPINKNINVWYLGVGVSYNIASLYKSNKRVRRAVVDTRRVEQEREVAAEQLSNDVQEAHTLYRQSFVELDTQRKNVALATQNYQVVNDRYLNQLALVTDMVDAANVKLNAELLEVDARINTIFALYKLRFVAGTL